MKTGRMWAAVIAATWLAACGNGNSTTGSGSGGTSSNSTSTSTSTSTSSNTGGSSDITLDLDACTQGMSDAQIADNAQIAFDFKESCHEMVVCGGLIVAFAAALVEVIVELITNPGDPTPEGYTYAGNGVYHVEADGFTDVSMDLQVLRNGQPLTANLFSLDSYLQGASVSIDPIDQTVEIDYASPGPLVELLGMGPTPPNPIVADLADLQATSAELRALQITGHVDVLDEQSVSQIVYAIDANGLTVGGLVDGSAIGWDLVSASGTRADKGQSLTTDQFDVAYSGGQLGVLDGTILFGVTGGDFAFNGSFVYDSSPHPAITLTCP